MKLKLTLVLTGLVLTIAGMSQKKDKENSIKFGDVTAAEFTPQFYELDSAAQAVILYDAGRANYEGSTDSWFNIVYTYHKRVRLMNKNAFNLATIEIPLYKGDNNNEEKLEKLEAVTYNIENGKVVKTKLDRESIFKDKASKYYTINKFTFPNIKEGCIIEYTYSIVSPRATNLRSWYFQDAYPILQSDYEVTIPTLFNFVFLKNGYYDLEPKVKQGHAVYSILSRGMGAYDRSENFNYNATTINSIWSLKNIAPIVKENYTSTLQNHISKIEFQLSSLNYPNQPPQPVMSTWKQLTEELLKDKDFGEALSENNYWLEADLKKLLVFNNDIATAKNIFSFVKDRFVCTDHDAKYLTEPLKKVYGLKKGNVADINLTLVAMLLKANIKAEPVLLSTRDNGMAYEQFPLINKFNYVIARAEINGTQYLLDASQKKLGFNHLPDYCYNGYGRRVSATPYTLALLPDSLTESKLTSVFISNDDNGKKMIGSFSSTLGYYESYGLRQRLISESREDLFQSIKKSYGYEIDMKNADVEMLDSLEDKASVKYDFEFEVDEDIVYFSPLLTEAYKTNPFKALKRNYPVEMPYASDEIIVINMDIPKGYKIDEIPKSERIELNGDEGKFEYIIAADAQKIQLRCRLKINKATFYPEDYETLRDFYSYVVKKQGEQIVFKKIK